MPAVSAAAAASPVPPSPSSTNTRGYPLFHFDLYRLGSSDELFDIGWEDYLARGGVCAVEWSERAEDAFDGSTVRIDFRRGAQHDGWRVITITGVDGL
ncbi:MAG: tRNA (adenosine(37)-N6)-threonylcarbamoyltransferase complex ATPase subunit type 1 TsaE [Oscillospiraceae bacterium]